MLSPGVANFLFETLNFLLLAGLLGYVFWRPVRRVLEQERERYTTQRDQAAQALQEAEAALRAAGETRANAAKSAQAEREHLLEAARSEATQLLAEARRAQTEMRAASTLEQSRMRDELTDALTERVASLAAESLRALLAQLDGPALDFALTRGACLQLRELSSDALAQAVVESARPLDEPARQLLEQTLNGPLHARTLPELGAGVRVTTSQGQVDASALGLARRAAEALRETAALPQGSHA